MAEEVSSTRPDDPPRRAAEYVRMSTVRQQYSTENQAKISRNAPAEIIRTYADEGRSGLRIDGRDALKRLIADVENRTGRPILTVSWCTTSAGGAGSRTPTSAPTTNTSAGALASLQKGLGEN